VLLLQAHQGSLQGCCLVPGVLQAVVTCLLLLLLLLAAVWCGSTLVYAGAQLTMRGTGAQAVPAQRYVAGDMARGLGPFCRGFGAP